VMRAKVGFEERKRVYYRWNSIPSQ
jgi:hypothetical protein